jgi:hypothetical protein
MGIQHQVGKSQRDRLVFFFRFVVGVRLILFVWMMSSLL